MDEEYLKKIWEANPEMNYEELIVEFDNLKQRGGLLSSFVRENYNETSKRTLSEYGDKRVIALNIYRTPLGTLSETLLNIATFGGFNKAKLDAGYDKMFHLALVATVADNGKYKNIILEKDPKISISTHYPTNKDTEVHPVNLHNKQFTINEMTERLRDKLGDKEYFTYSAFRYKNCQDYVKGLLESMGLLNNATLDFIYQPLNKILEKLPSYVPALSDSVTDMGAISHQILGKGFKHAQSNIRDRMKTYQINMNGSGFGMDNY